MGNFFFFSFLFLGALTSRFIGKVSFISGEPSKLTNNQIKLHAVQLHKCITAYAQKYKQNSLHLINSIRSLLSLPCGQRWVRFSYVLFLSCFRWMMRLTLRLTEYKSRTGVEFQSFWIFPLFSVCIVATPTYTSKGFSNAIDTCAETVHGVFL